MRFKEVMMKNQPNAGYNSDDVVQTPPAICERVTEHLIRQWSLQGKSVLEPCAGEGNFVKAIESGLGRVIEWCEIKKGKDFYEYEGNVDWIITNPPFSHIRNPRGTDTHPMSFLEKSFQVADNVGLILTLNHAIGLKSRYNLSDKYGFHIKEIALLDTPPEPWPQSGFQVGFVIWSKNKDPRASYLATGWHHYKILDWRNEQ